VKPAKEIDLMGVNETHREIAIIIFNSSKNIDDINRYAIAYLFIYLVDGRSAAGVASIIAAQSFNFSFYFFFLSCFDFN